MVTKNRNVGSRHRRSATSTPRQFPTGAPPQSSLLASEFVRIAGHERSTRMATLESSLLASEIVRILGVSSLQVETHRISPGKQDLPIGYWKWARDGEFR
jgi:hypothetical protein